MKKFPIATQEIGSIRKPRWLVKLLQDKNVSDEIKESARSDVALMNLKLFELREDHVTSTICTKYLTVKDHVDCF